MPTSISDLDAAIAAIKATDSGKVEYNANSGSLKTVTSIERNLLLQGLIFPVGDIASLQLIGQVDATYVALTDSASGASAGLYSYRPIGSTAPDYTTSFPAVDGGVWRLITVAG